MSGKNLAALIIAEGFGSSCLLSEVQVREGPIPGIMCLETVRSKYKAPFDRATHLDHPRHSSGKMGQEIFVITFIVV